MLGGLGALAAVAAFVHWRSPAALPEMKLIPAGAFVMGSTEDVAWPEEKPAHRVRLTRAFWMDAQLVTNAEFQRFVAATGYATVAERPVRWDDLRGQLPLGTAPPPAALLRPGSLVFVMPTGPVDLRGDVAQWWRWMPGAQWRTPQGPGQGIDQRMDHPVVQLAWEDAQAYCRWAGKRLPSEAEWERAARGGVDGQRYVWGAEPTERQAASGRWLANLWQGRFPAADSAQDGHAGTSPVGRYPPNAYGLHDMAGNVWEWAADWYDPAAYQGRSGEVVDPRGPAQPTDAARRRVQRGGSFLCNDSYCTRYRVAARQGAAADSGSSHAGVRCARDAD